MFWTKKTAAWWKLFLSVGWNEGGNPLFRVFCFFPIHPFPLIFFNSSAAFFPLNWSCCNREELFHDYLFVLASMFKQSKERYKLNSFFLVLWRGNKTRFLIKFYNNLKRCFEEGNIAFLLERRYSKITIKHVENWLKNALQ